MTVIYVVLPLALLFATLAVTAFIWTVRSGQLDDLDSPSLRILTDDLKDRRLASRSRSGADRDPAR